MIAPLRPDDPPAIGPYRLAGQLGGGGMGQVFLGRSADGQPVAVKVIRAELASDPEFRTRFRHEVAAARKVSGKFTAQVVDADLDGPVQWLATTYVAGPSLAEAVSRDGPLPVDKALRLAAGLARADLERRAGVARGAVTNYECYGRTPRRRNLAGLARVLPGLLGGAGPAAEA